MPAKKILFCTDFSRLSEAALPLATSLARDQMAELVVIHVQGTTRGLRGWGTILRPYRTRQENLTRVAAPSDTGRSNGDLHPSDGIWRSRNGNRARGERRIRRHDCHEHTRSYWHSAHTYGKCSRKSRSPSAMPGRHIQTASGNRLTRVCYSHGHTIQP